MKSRHKKKRIEKKEQNQFKTNSNSFYITEVPFSCPSPNYQTSYLCGHGPPCKQPPDWATYQQAKFHLSKFPFFFLNHHFISILSLFYHHFITILSPLFSNDSKVNHIDVVGTVEQFETTIGILSSYYNSWFR
jgi:hypothetical protein